MSSASFGELFTAAISGGLVVKAIDIAYAELRKYLDRSRDSEISANKHLEPLLKSADELVGKLRSLIESDFKPIVEIDPTPLRWGITSSPVCSTFSEDSGLKLS